MPTDAMTPAEQVAAIRARRPGFGGGYGSGFDGVGGSWYDASIYPGDTYPCLPPEWFARLQGGRLVGPGWMWFTSPETADRAALEAVV